MYLRGSDYPLTWDSGRSMLNVSSDVWVYETERIGKGESFELKPLINDTTWSSGATTIRLLEAKRLTFILISK